MRERYVSFANVSAQDRAVGERVAHARKSLRVSQAKLAPLVGLTRDQLNNIELGRVALRADAGVRLCLELDCNPLWLAYGSDFERMPFIRFAPLGTATSRQGFSEFIARHRDAYIAVRAAVVAHDEGSLDRLTAEQEAILSLLKTWAIRIVADDYWAIARHLRRAAEEFDLAKGALTQHARSVIVARMKPHERASRWEQLRKRLNRATTRRGTQVALARVLGVTRQAVSEWLRKPNRAPSAETTLRLLEWVTAEEAKPKTKRPASARTDAGLTTQQQKSTSHEKRKSSQQKYNEPD